MPPDDVLRQPQPLPQRADLVLEQVAQRLDEREGQILGQSADVVVELDRGGRAVGRAAAFDHVGIEGPLGEELGPFDPGGLVGETLDEGVADPPPLLLRIDHPGQGRQEPLLRMDHVQVGLEMIA